jgi:hypothetical protein
MVAAFHALLDGLTFDANGGGADAIDLSPVGRLSAAHRALTAGGATYDHARAATAICRAMKPFALSQIPTGGDGGTTVGAYFTETRLRWVSMLAVGDPGTFSSVRHYLSSLSHQLNIIILIQYALYPQINPTPPPPTHSPAPSTQPSSPPFPRLYIYALSDGNLARAMNSA